MILAGIILNVIGAVVFMSGLIGFISGMFSLDYKPGDGWFAVAAAGGVVWTLGIILLVAGLILHVS